MPCSGATKPQYSGRKQRLAVFRRCTVRFVTGGVPVNLYAKRLCGASRRALAPPSSSNPQPRRTSSAEVRGEESPDRGDSSRPRAPQEPQVERTRLRQVRCVGAPRPPPRPLAPPTARERARGLGPFHSEPPSATNSCAGRPRQMPEARIAQPSSSAKLKQQAGREHRYFPPSPAHSPGARPLTQACPWGREGVRALEKARALGHSKRNHFATLQATLTYASMPGRTRWPECRVCSANQPQSSRPRSLTRACP